MMYDFPMSQVGSNEIEFFVRCEILLVDGKTPCTSLYSFTFSLLNGSIVSSLYVYFLEYYRGDNEILSFMLGKN